MDRENSLDRFQFDDHFLVYDYVDLVSTVKIQALIRDREMDLAFERQSPKMQFMAQTLFVSGFEQSRTELTMHFDRRADDRSSSRVLLVFDFSVSL